MTEPTTPDPQLNRAGRRAEHRRLRKTGAALATLPAALGTTALLLGATTLPAGAATLTVDNLGPGAGAGTLRQALADANDGDTIVFQAGLTGTIDISATGTLLVPDGVTIQGPGASVITIDGGGAYRVFEITADSADIVTISGLTITQGSSSSTGGGIAVNAGADLVLTDVVVSDSSANDDGGGLYVSDDTSAVTITGSTFSGNEARYGDGGGVFFGNGASLVVTDSTFTDNEAYDDGGAIGIQSIAGTVTVTGSTFTENRAPAVVYYEGGGYGGAIYTRERAGAFTITGSTFTGNFAGIDGGAVFDAGGPSIEIIDSTFTDNSVQEFDGGALGANSDIVTVTDSTFSGNSTADDGGALYVRNSGAVVTVTGSRFTGNQATGAGDRAGDGASIHIKGGTSLTISGSTFTDNTAYADAGGVFIEDADLALTITGSTFTGNEATFYDGAALAVDEAASVSISFSTFAGNTAGDQGGALYFDDVYGAVTIANSTISGNQVIAAEGEYNVGDGDGGGIFAALVEDGIVIENSTISGNIAAGEGGAVFLSNFYRNDEEMISSYTSSLTVTQSTITANQATTIGGIAIVPDNVGLEAAGAGGDQDERPGKGQPRKGAEAADEPVGAAAVANPTTVFLDGAIVALNSGIDIGQAGTVRATGSLWTTISGSTLEDLGGNLVGVDPLLGALQDNGGPTQTHALLDGSPAINAGPDPVADFPGNADDQRGPGYPRVIGGRVDIGAFEAQPTDIEPTFTG